jgi:hypothetical protein
MNARVTIQNMIIENERVNPMHDDHSYNYQDPLTEVDHQVPSEFEASLAMHHEIRDEQAHRLQVDLVKHL